MDRKLRHHAPGGDVHGADPALLLRLEHAVAELLAGPVDDGGQHDEAMFRPLLRAVGDALGWPVAIAWTVRQPEDAADPADSAVRARLRQQPAPAALGQH